MSQSDTSLDEALVQDYDLIYAGYANSPTRRRIYRQVYGDDYPTEADPCSYITLSDLRRIAHELDIRPGQALADLACGRGGPGLFVARETGAELVGIDISEVGVKLASQQAEAFGISEHARFQVGSFAATGLPSAAFDGAMSVDAIFYAEDQAAAACEVARILLPGSRFVFTTWDPDLSPMRDAGFSIEVCEETTGGNDRHRAVYEAARSAQADLIAEMGDYALGRWLDEGDRMTGRTDGVDRLAHVRHVLVVAEKA